MDVSGLGSVYLPDARGKPHRLGDLWTERRVVLVFARHFGCLNWRAYAARLRSHYEEISSRGAELVAIGTGGVRHARAFVDALGLPFPVLADHRGEAARAADVRRVGFCQLFDPRSFEGTLEAWRAGHRIGRPGPRVTQLGATFVLAPGSELLYAHWDSHTADHAPLPDVLATLER